MDVDEMTKASSEKENTEYEPSAKKRSAAAAIAVSCAVICVVALCVVGYIVNQNNKRISREYAMERINTLVDDIYEVGYSGGNDYLMAKDKLREIRTLIDENDIAGITVEKYEDASSYLSDLETLDQLYGLDFSDRESYVRQAGALLQRVSNDKIINRIVSETGIIQECAEAVRHVIVGKAFYNAEQYFVKNYPNDEFRSITEISPRADYPGYYGSVVGYTAPGGERMFTSEKDAADNFDYVDAGISVDSAKKIKNAGGYAITICFWDIDMESEYHDYRQAWVWWYAGVDVSARLVNGQLLFDITEYSEGTPEEKTGLGIDEALNFVMLRCE